MWGLLSQLMANTLNGANGQSAQQLVVGEHKCVIAPAPTLHLRMEESLVWIRAWEQSLKPKCAMSSLARVSWFDVKYGKCLMA